MTQEHLSDMLTPALAARHAAAFSRKTGPQDTGPQGIHWCLTTPDIPTDALGPDGHPPHDGAPGLPRRMWAASALTFHAPIRVGAIIERVSHIADSTEKAGKTGRLLFQTHVHDITADGTPAITERQSIVYRAAARPGVSPPPSGPPLELHTWDWERSVTPDALMLFRFSALTFNSHRIHYDLPYATGVEGYAGLVVHGPLMASLLLDLTDREMGRDALVSFAFRAVSPAFAGNTLRLLAARDRAQIDFAIADDGGNTVMTAQGTLRPGS